MSDFLPVLYAIALWWAGTAILLALIRRPRETHGRLVAGATVSGLAGIVGVLLVRDDSSVFGHTVAFACAIAVWAWQETAFLTGHVTGPRVQPSLATPGSARHFRHAVASLLYHELFLLGLMALLWMLTLNAANPLAWQVFALLWIMRLSAKLNLFFGVRNTGVELLPAHLAHLRNYFARRGMNLLFPVSITAGTVALVVLLLEAQARMLAGADASAPLLLGTLLALALFEHWIMVLPWNGEALWRVALAPSGEPPANPAVRQSPGAAN